MVHADLQVKRSRGTQPVIQAGPADGGGCRDRGKRQQVATRGERACGHRAADQRSSAAAHLHLDDCVGMVRVGEKADVGVARPEGGREPLPDPPPVFDEECAHRTVSDRAALGGEDRTGVARSVARSRLDLVPTAGLQDELRRRPPGPALALGQKPAYAPLDSVAEATLQLQRAHSRRQAAGVEGVGVGPVRQRHELDPAAQRTERGKDWRGRRDHRRGHSGLIRHGQVVRGRLQHGAPLVPHQPVPLGEVRVVRLVLFCLGGPVVGGLGHGSEAQREERVTIGEDRDTLRGRGEVTRAERPERVGPCRERGQDELALAVRERHEASALNPLTEDGDDRSCDRSPAGALDPAHEPSAVLRTHRRAGQEGGSHNRHDAAAKAHISSSGEGDPLGTLDRIRGGDCLSIRGADPVRGARRTAHPSCGGRSPVL